MSSQHYTIAPTEVVTTHPRDISITTGMLLTTCDFPILTACDDLKRRQFDIRVVAYVALAFDTSEHDDVELRREGTVHERVLSTRNERPPLWYMHIGGREGEGAAVIRLLVIS